MSPPGAAPLLLVISAPSGGGKTTVCEQLLTHVPALTRAITCTTRPPRPGERDGIDYYFLDPVAFQRRVAAGDFLEHATVHGRSYGTLKSEVLVRLRAGRDLVLNIDVQGASTIRRQAAGDLEVRRSLATVFLAPPSLQILEERLYKRGTDAPEVIAERLRVARQEMAQWVHFDYVVVSGTIAEDLHRVRTIYEAEKLRSARCVAPVGL